MEDEKVETAVADEANSKIMALRVLKEVYSDMLNEYERYIDEVAALGRVPRQTLYNPAVLHELESDGLRKKFDDLLSAVWIAQAQLGDIIAVQRTMCVLKRTMADEEVTSAEKKTREIEHEKLPYETM